MNLWFVLHTGLSMMSSRYALQERDAYHKRARRFLPGIEICRIPCRLAPGPAIPDLGLHSACMRRSKLDMKKFVANACAVTKRTVRDWSHCWHEKRLK